MKKEHFNNIPYHILIYSLPFTNVFSLTEKISLPIFIWSIYTLINFRKLKFSRFDVFYLLFIIFLIIPSLRFGLDKSSFLYIASFITLYFIFYKSSIILYNSHKVTFYRDIYIITIISSIYIIYEFVSKNFLPQIYFELPRARVLNLSATFGGKFYRARGFAEEPGHMALFYEFAIMLSIYYINYYIGYLKKSVNYFLFFFLVLLAIFFINSSISFLLLFLPLLLIIIKVDKLKMKTSNVIIIFFILIMVLIILIMFSNTHILQSSYEKTIKKITLQKTNNSVYDRINRLHDALKIISKYPFGIKAMGMRDFCDKGSSLNILVDIIMYSGITGFIFIILFLFQHLYMLMKLRSEIRFYLGSSLLMVFLHYMIITNYWYPYIWIIIGIIFSEFKQRV